MRRTVLVVAPWLPWPADFGGALRVYHLIRELSHGHKVILVAPARREDRFAILHLGSICDVTAVPARWTFRQPASVRKRAQQIRSMFDRQSFLERMTRNLQLQAVVDRLFLTRTIDIVQYEFTQMALFRPPRPCPTLIDAHNVEYELLRRVAHASDSAMQQAFNTLEWRKVRRLEERLWSRSTVNLATSSRDAHLVRSAAGDQVMVVPNGVDTAGFQSPPRRARRPHHVIFTGAMRHQPNADGARWYVERVHPLVRARVPDATVALVGADPPPDVLARASESVRVTGKVERIQPFLHDSSVAVVPLHSGGGTRLKILEAWAAGLPVVSTTIGAEGLDARDGENIVLADTPDRFADAVVHVMRSPETSERLASEGLRTAREQYDWSNVAAHLVSAHEIAIERFRSNTHASTRDSASKIKR